MLSGYVSGNESLRVDRFEVPEALEGERFRVRLTAQGYQLLSPDNELLGAQRIGQTLAFTVDGEQGLLLVTAATGKPGAEFNLTRHVRLEVIEQLQKDLVIAEEGKQSGVIRASLEGKDPREITRVLNEIGTLYVRQNVERKVAEADKSLGFLSTFLPELRRQLEAAETKFSQFRNRNSSFDLDTEGKLILEQAVKLQTSVVELQQKRKELLALYTAEHHSVRAIDAKIAALQGELDTLNKRVKKLPDVEQELLSLTRDVKVNNELYVKLLDNAQQLRLVKEGKVANVRIVDPAAAPRKPAKPLRALSVLLATTLGLLAGLALAFLRNSLRPGLKDPTEIEQRTGLHVFATVPHSDAQTKLAREAGKYTARRPLLAMANPQDAGGGKPSKLSNGAAVHHAGFSHQHHPDQRPDAGRRQVLRQRQSGGRPGCGRQEGAADRRRSAQGSFEPRDRREPQGRPERSHLRQPATGQGAASRDRTQCGFPVDRRVAAEFGRTADEAFGSGRCCNRPPGTTTGSLSIPRRSWRRPTPPSSPRWPARSSWWRGPRPAPRASCRNRRSDCLVLASRSMA